MTGRRDFSRSTYGISASVAATIGVVSAVSDHDKRATIFFVVLLAVCLFVLERSSRAGSKWSQPVRMTPSGPASSGTGRTLLTAAVAIAFVLRIVSGRLAFGWIGAVVIAIGGWFFFHPEPANPARQRALAVVACLLGALLLTAALANYGTF